MSRHAKLLISAISAGAILLGASVAHAETISGGAAGAGYTALDAPLGAPTELRIDLRGQVAARCEVTAPPSGFGRLVLGRAGEAQGAFGIDCNAPFNLRVRSERGAFVAEEPAPGTVAAVPYRVSVAVGTDAGRQDLGWCDAAALTDASGQACAWGAASPTRGWSSGGHTAIGQTGALRLRWDEPRDDGAPLGRYNDIIVIQLEVRS